MSVAERFVDKIETEVAICREKLKAAENRGYPTPEELKYLNDAEWSRLPIYATAFEMAARRDGKSVRSRRDLIPDVLERKGLHISTSGPRPSVYLYGTIGESHGGISAADVRSQLATFRPSEAINFHVNSPGGSFSEGVAIHSLISDRDGPTHGFVDGQAASAGSLILMPCETITMAPASTMMIHNASVENGGGSMTEGDLARALKLVSDTNAKLVGLYQPRWKGTQAELRAALEAESYFTPAEAVQAGLADYISDSVKAASYEVVTGYANATNYSLAASAGPHKRFNMQKATLALWQMEADSMRAEIGR
jgi:ATP-dependent protease ClpP protease subunit